MVNKEVRSSNPGYSVIVQVSGEQRNVTLEELSPYSELMFEVEACTIAGCIRSEPSRTVTTLEAGQCMAEVQYRDCTGFPCCVSVLTLIHVLVMKDQLI